MFRQFASGGPILPYGDTAGRNRSFGGGEAYEEIKNMPRTLGQCPNQHSFIQGNLTLNFFHPESRTR